MRLLGGFDRIAQAHASATRKQAFKSGEAEAFALCALIPLLPPLPVDRIYSLPRRRRTVSVQPVPMAKEKTAALEHAKKATTTVKGKKMNRGSSSRSALPPGWI